MLDLDPSTILLLVFCVLLTKHVVTGVGKANIQGHVWTGYTLIASRAGHPKFVELSKKRAELVQINKERKAISAQDHYARWTKLNRQFDKLSTEIAAIAEEMSADKARVAKLVGIAITVATTVPIWFSRVWFRKSVLFYFPQGVLPHYLEWFLALPFIATGGVGLTIWMFAVNSVLGSLGLFLLFILESPITKPEFSPKVEEVPAEKMD